MYHWSDSKPLSHEPFSVVICENLLQAEAGKAVTRSEHNYTTKMYGL